MRRLKLTEDQYEEVMADILARIQKGSSTGKIRFEYDLSKWVPAGTPETCTIQFTPEAWTKIQIIMMESDYEIAAHGLVSRLALDHFLVYDILVYPQTVTAVTVESDDEHYAKWVMNLEDEQLHSMRFQFHSHVNMPTIPSTTDNTNREEMLRQVEDYYIFMILNKAGDTNFVVFDMENNLLWEDEDCLLDFLLESTTYDDFLTELTENVTVPKKVVAKPAHPTYTKPVAANDKWQKQYYYRDSYTDDYDEADKEFLKAFYGGSYK